MNAVLVPSSPSYPALYTAARAALFRCDQLDECREWSSKAAAMESYARQSKDMDLLHMAQRIRDRAVRRCGELLQAVPEARGVKSGQPTRTAAARAAGLSEHQQATAMQVAAVPSKVFEDLVEDRKPASVSKLASIGKIPTGRASDFATKRIKRFAKFCDVSNPKRLGETLDAAASVRAIAEWCRAYLEGK